MAYFNRGAVLDIGVDHNRPNGMWAVIKIFQDDQGRVGRRMENETTRYLDIDRQAAAESKQTPPKDPIWPRWPSGYEGGPEQVRR